MLRAILRRSQHGTTSVEFAIIAVLLLTLILAVIEFGRAWFTLSVLSESTRRAARLAAVCPINSPAIANAATFAGLPGFSASNVQLNYLNQAGAPVASPGTNTAAIRYVRVNVTGYSFDLTIPFISPTIAAPAFAVTMPRESLGADGAGGTLGC